VMTEPAAAAGSPEDIAAQTLADRYSPVVRLQEDSSRCEDGERFQPTDVEAVLGDQQVALRGPWRPPDLVKPQPEDSDLGRGYPGHFLDFPGDPLRPGCDYAEWSARINAKHPATVYAHVASDPEFPGQLSLEYWFFYVFNDYNNTHEGDWESIQLIFAAATPAAALTMSPTAVGYSQHGRRTGCPGRALLRTYGAQAEPEPDQGPVVAHRRTTRDHRRAGPGGGTDRRDRPAARH
jgi:hypothetical protein